MALPAMTLADYKVLSFDCYGTLIDWKAGILAALAPLVALAPQRPSDDALLARFAEVESAEQAAHPRLPYPIVLARVHARLAADLEIVASPALHDRFGGSVADWPAFPDSAAALASLGKGAKLVILSNVDRSSFAASAGKLGDPFAAVYTAQDIGSYKPDARNFAYLIRKVSADFGVGTESLLHVAQSLFHDHVPAKAAGLATVWIDRRQGRGGGATPATDGTPAYDYRFPDLAEFAAAVAAARQR